MNWAELLKTVAREPVFTTGVLLAGAPSREGIHKQLSRWVRAGKLQQLGRGLYTLAEPYRKVSPHPFLMANYLRRPSYVSLQSALAHYGLIPEYVPEVTSITTGRPGRITTPLGRFSFRHLKREHFHGVLQTEMAPGQFAFLASPEKCLLDLVHLTPRGDDEGYLRELRLQNLEALSTETLLECAAGMGSPKLRRAASVVAKLVEEEKEHQAL